MNTPTQEEVLVIYRADIQNYIGLPKKGVKTKNIKGVKDLFSDKMTFFNERNQAEIDPNKKQLIPYCILKNGNKFLRYTRGKKGGESRLHAKKSIGIGGHINPIDAKADPHNFDTYLEAVKREIQEEVGITLQTIPEPICILNDDSNEVGQVHLGIIHIINISNEEAKAAEDAIENLEEVTLNTLQIEKDSLESWSQIIIESNILA